MPREIYNALNIKIYQSLTVIYVIVFVANVKIIYSTSNPENFLRYSFCACLFLSQWGMEYMNRNGMACRTGRVLELNFQVIVSYLMVLGTQVFWKSNKYS